MSYDENHFLITSQIDSDVMSNYLISYERTSDRIIQTWFSIADTTDSETFNKRETYLLNKGKIDKIISDAGRYVTNFRYEGEKLVEKQIVDDKDVISAWKYYYKHGEIDRIEYFEGGVLRLEYLFEDGLPSYLQYREHRSHKLFYKYFY